MNRTKKIVIGISLVCSLAILAGAFIASRARQEAPAQPEAQVEQRPVSKTELAAATGKDGKKCYVAVDGTVYEIKDFSLWQNGDHKPSDGQAYCGADMSEVITKSPHGKRVLDMLIKVGPLQS